MKKVLISDKLGQPGIDYLMSRDALKVDNSPGLSPDDLLKHIADADALIVRSGTKVTADVLAAAPNLQVVGRAGIGVDNIDVRAATERGVVVINTPDANATTTAELTVAHLMSLSRHLPQADRSMRDGQWARSQFMGTELSGKTIGIVGFGTIGRIVASRCQGLQMRVLAFDPFVTDEVFRSLNVEGKELDDLLAEADYVTLHCPKNDKTAGIIDEAAIGKMKRGARLINCARGGLVDESALARALEDGRISGAALDVYETEPPKDSPLVGMPNVVLTPHLGASTAEAQTKVAEAIARQVATFLETGEAVHALNLPPVSSESLAKVRPYQRLALKLGRLMANLVDGPLDELEVRLSGQASELETGPVASEALVGLLRERLDKPVNRVNVGHMAKAQGIALTEARSEESPDYVSLLTLTGRHGGNKTVVQGTLLGERQPRLVRIDEYEIEAVPEGPILMTEHEDKPGVIGALGSILGEKGVNISRMQVGMNDKGEAIALLGISRLLSPKGVEEVGAHEAIKRVIQVEL